MKARFEQLRNDLYWSFYDVESDEIYRWIGYNDWYWWQNVANDDVWRTREQFYLDPHTGEVSKLPSTPLETEG